MNEPDEEVKSDFRQGIQLLETGQPDQAIRLFRKVRKAWHDDPDIRYLEGLAYGRLSDINGVIRSSERALALQPDHFGALCNLANTQMLTGDKESALINYKKALEQRPDALDVIDNYGRALGMLGLREEAIAHFRSALDINSNYGPAHASLGRAYSEGGDPIAGMEEFKIALRLSPNDYGVNLGIADLYMSTGLIADSEHHYKLAISLQRRAPEAYIGLAGVESYKGNYREALELLETAEALGTTDHPAVAAGKAACYERLDELDTAFDILEQLTDDEKVTPSAVIAYTKICRKFGACDRVLELVNRSINAPSTDTMRKQSIQYATGDLLDKLGRYDEAFEYFRLANEAIKYQQRNDYKRIYNGLMERFDKLLLQNAPKAETKSSRPVFIVGMPRSGTTLTEQILASHPEVFGAGELADIQQLSIECTRLPGINSARFTELANKYLSSLDHYDSMARFVTDKMPSNFQHIGLISLLFPEARVIHCRRNPLDNCLSIYFQNFIWIHDYATDLASIGRYYQQYDRLMRYWEMQVDIPIMTVQYEDMIDDQETMSRMLLDFCGLDWNDSVLEFYNSKRSVATASYAQVRQPIYKTSRNRWKNYANHLSPLKQNLPEHLLAGIADLDLIPDAEDS